jgi:hypothetical protein
MKLKKNFSIIFLQYLEKKDENKKTEKRKNTLQKWKKEKNKKTH